MFPELPVVKALQRPQLRLPRILPLMFIAVTIAVIAFVNIWLGEFSEYGHKLLAHAGRSFGLFCLAAQYVGLVVLGSFTISGGVDRDRDSGILAFHRLTPMSPDSITIGYIVGLGSTALLVWAAFALFGLAGVVMGGIGLPDYLIITALILLSGFFFYLLTTLVSLSFPHRGPTRFFYTAAISLLPLVLLEMPMDIAFLTPLPSAMACFGAEQYKNHYSMIGTLMLFNIKVSPLAYSLLLQAVLGSQIYLAVRRKVRLPEAPEISKTGAMLLFTTLAFFLTGRSLQYLPDTGFGIPDAILSVLIVLAVMLSAIVMPGRLHFRRHFARRHQGERSISVWNDDAPVLPVSLMMVGLAIVTYLLLVYATGKALPDGYAPAIAARLITLLAVLVFVVYLFEWSRLSLRRHADWVAGTIVAFWWLLPQIIAVSLQVSSHNSISGVYISGISPLPTLFDSLGQIKDIDEDLYRSIYYLSPVVSLLFASLALLLGRRARRRMAAEVVLRRDDR